MNINVKRTTEHRIEVAADQRRTTKRVDRTSEAYKERMRVENERRSKFAKQRYETDPAYRAQLVSPGRPPRPLEEFPCRCWVDEDAPAIEHKSYCPRGLAARRRIKKECTEDGDNK